MPVTIKCNGEEHVIKQGRFKHPLRLMKVRADIKSVMGKESLDRYEIADRLHAKGIKINVRRELYLMKQDGLLTMCRNPNGTTKFGQCVYAVV